MRENSINAGENADNQLEVIMHQIHPFLNSITKDLNFLSHKDLSKWKEQEIVKEKILELCEYANSIRMELDYLQMSENRSTYFENMRRDRLPLWDYFNNPNEYFKSIMKKKRISYRVKKEDRIIPDVEAFSIIRSISNIMLDNAIKYAPSDSTIDCLFEIDGKHLKITMENEGPYLMSNEIDLIFEKGERGTNAKKAGIRGHGYGMDFLNLIVEAHDGWVDIESEKTDSRDDIPYGIFRCTVTLPL